MFTSFTQGLRWAAAISIGALISGCLNDSESPRVHSATAAEPATASTMPPPNPEAEPADTPSMSAPPLRHVPLELPELSPGLREIIRLAQSGVGEEVLLAYVEKSSSAFAPTVDELVYLNDIGIPAPVIAAMVRRSQPASAELEIPAAAAPTAALSAPPPSAEVAAAPQPDYPGGVAAAAPVAPASVTQINHFYTDLAPYGTWLELPGYGWCWQPAVAVLNTHWRPYHDRGRWIYTNAGWYWQSDYSWGWAAFHYGRWFQHTHRGWVWVPGHTWGPAWVSWRWSPSYCGWAPLPPTASYVSGIGFTYHRSRVGVSFEFGLRSHHYTFVPTYRFCDPYPYRYYVSHTRSKPIYQQTTIINNYIVGNQNTVINEGVPRQEIATIARTEIPKVQIRELPAAASRPGLASARSELRPDRLVKDGSALAIYRPSPAEVTARNNESSTVRRDQEVRKGGTPSAAPEPAAQRSPVTFGSRSAGAGAKAADGDRNPANLSSQIQGRPGASTLPLGRNPAGLSRAGAAQTEPAATAATATDSAATPTASTPEENRSDRLRPLTPPQTLASPQPVLPATARPARQEVPKHPGIPSPPQIRPQPGVTSLTPPQPVTSIPTPPQIGVNVAPAQPSASPGSRFNASPSFQTPPAATRQPRFPVNGSSIAREPALPRANHTPVFHAPQPAQNAAPSVPAPRYEPPKPVYTPQPVFRPAPAPSAPVRATPAPSIPTRTAPAPVQTPRFNPPPAVRSAPPAFTPSPRAAPPAFTPPPSSRPGLSGQTPSVQPPSRSQPSIRPQSPSREERRK